MSSFEIPNIIFIPITITIMDSTMNNRARGIQSGEVTHHHDQSIKFVSFRTKNIRNNAPDKLIPLVVLESDILFYVK
jgi:hypothetical protein